MKTTKPVCLCGFMGCGKSYCGERIKTLLKINFIDLDEYITAREKRSIPDIFKDSGAEYFRKCELEALLTLKGFYVVALGGGTLTNPGCLEFAEKNATVIFIDTDFDICFYRIKDDKNRPNAYNKSRGELYKLYLSRIETYKNAADYIVKNEDELISLLKELI